MEDYMANRKGPQAGSTAVAGGLFGAAGTTQTTQASGFNFGGQQQKPAGFGG